MRVILVIRSVGANHVLCCYIEDPYPGAGGVLVEYASKTNRSRPKKSRK